MKSVGLSVQEKFKIHLKADGHGVHYGFSFKTFLAIFLSTSHLSKCTSNEISSQLAFRLNFKMDLEDGSHGVHLGFPIRMILSIFLCTSHPENFL